MLPKLPLLREKNLLAHPYTLPVFLSLALLLLRIIYLTSLTPYGLAPDEAQYWHWLSHNDWSFLTKPPLTTWAIGLSTAVLGDTLLGVKLWALLSQALIPLLGMALAQEIASHTPKATPKTSQTHITQAGWWAFTLLLLSPLIHVGGLIMAPDTLLVPFWMAALLCTARAFRPNLPEAKALCFPRWLIIGTLIGLAGLAKYSAGLFFPLLGAWLLFTRPAWLNPLKQGKTIWLAGVVALLFQAPVLIWNLQHDWAGVTHVLWQVDGGGDTRHGGFTSLLDLFLSQGLVVGFAGFPLLLAAWGWALKHHRTLPPATAFVAFTSGAIMMGFAVLSFTGKVQANWPVLATLPGLALAGVWLGRLFAKPRPWLLGAVAVGLLTASFAGTLLYHTPDARLLGVPLKLKTDPTKDLLGWPEMGQLLGLLLRHLENPVLLTTRYQTAAALAFHTPGHPQVLYLNPGERRANNYDLWPWPNLTARIVVYVTEKPELPMAVIQRFNNCIPWHSLGVEETPGRRTRALATWICWQPR